MYVFSLRLYLLGNMETKKQIGTIILFHGKKERLIDNNVKLHRNKERVQTG